MVFFLDISANIFDTHLLNTIGILSQYLELQRVRGRFRKYFKFVCKMFEERNQDNKIPRLLEFQMAFGISSRIWDVRLGILRVQYIEESRI